MARARFLAAVVSSSISGAILLGGLALVERDAFAAAGSGVRPPTARTARARRSNDPPNAVRRAGDPPRENVSAASKDAPTRERSAQQEKSSARAAERSAKSVESTSTTKLAPSDTRVAAPSDVGKAPLDAASGRNGDGTPNKSPDGAPHRSSADATAARNADARGGAAKAPNETGSNTKGSPAPEKTSSDAPATDAAESSRPALDSASPVARREIASASGAAGSGTAARPVVVALEGPVFDGGDVPRAAAALERMKAAFSRCASVENALTKSEASIDLRFLVRAPGRAEGVDVDKVRGVSSDVVRCMTSVLARSYIGAPSDDPVGVALTVRVRKD